jgi:hypothetical protein
MKASLRHKRCKWFPSLLFATLPALLFTSCEHRALSPDDPCDRLGAQLQVVIRWTNTDPADLPQKGMAVHLFPWEDEGAGIRNNLAVEGGEMFVPFGKDYFVMCYDYYGNDYIRFRYDDDQNRIEAYQPGASGTYNTYARTADDTEPTVTEPYPYHFHATRNAEPARVWLGERDTVIYVHCYPRNELREFTFLIAGVHGAENIANCHGAVSGMSAAYRIKDAVRSAEPATVLFGYKAGRIAWQTDAHEAEWTQERLDATFLGNVLFSDFPADWRTKWQGDWVMGTFCTFGTADIVNPAINHRLTIEAVSTRMGYYHAVWGGGEERIIYDQLLGSMGGNGGHGTHEEQLAWRRNNGGFDIVITDGSSLDIPDKEGGGGGTGINVNAGEFENINIHIPIRGR